MKLKRNANGRFAKGNKGYWLNKKRGESPKKIDVPYELSLSLYWGNQYSIPEFIELCLMSLNGGTCFA